MATLKVLFSALLFPVLFLSDCGSAGEIRESYYMNGRVKQHYKKVQANAKYLTQGDSLVYYATGELMIRAHYRNGLLNGKFEEWYPSGKTKLIHYYRNNILNGAFAEWNEGGTQIINRTCKNGYPVAEH